MKGIGAATETQQLQLQKLLTFAQSLELKVILDSSKINLKLIKVKCIF